MPENIKKPENIEEPKVIDYRALSEEEKELMIEAKTLGNALGCLIDNIPEKLGSDDADSARARALAKTHIQTGLMWLNRAITKPETFC